MTATGGRCDTEALTWSDVSSFFEEHGCVVFGAPEMRWYREAWDALGAAGLQKETEYRCARYGRVVLRLRAVALMAMYLGIYQSARDSDLDGYFSEHAPLTWYLDALAVDSEALGEMVEERVGGSVESEDDDDGVQPWLDEVVEEMVREESDAVFRILDRHFGGEIGLFVSVWNSRRGLEETESVEEACNDAYPGDGKVELWSYVVGGMRGWSL